MSRKPRDKKEVDKIIKSHKSGESLNKILKDHGMSVSAFYRLLRVSRGEVPDPSKLKEAKRLARLEGALKQRDKEIALLKAALKKN